MKKFFTCALICLLLCVGVVTFAACNDKTPANVYEQASTFLTKIKEDKAEDGMFATKTILGVESEFALNLDTDSTFNKLLVVPMNFLNQYTNDLKRLDQIENISKSGKKQIENLSSALTKIEGAYNNSLKKFKEYKDYGAGASDALKEIALSDFYKSLKQMFECAYNSAMAVANIKHDVLDDYNSLQVTNEKISTEEAKTLRDFYTLSLANDLFKLIVQEFDLRDYSSPSTNENISEFSQLYNQTLDDLNKVFEILAIKDGEFSDLTGQPQTEDIEGEPVIIKYQNEKVSTLNDQFQIMQNERQLFFKSLDQFDLKDFYDQHCNMEAYKNSVQFAEKYYQEINIYVKQSIPDYCGFLSKNLKQEKI